MQSLAPTRRTRKIEPTIALINVVFLMLIFFLVAGTLAKPLDRDLKLVSAAELEATPPPDALVVYPDGRLAFRGQPTAAAAHVAERSVSEEAGEASEAGDKPLIRIVPDRALPASELVRIIAELRAAGSGRILIVTERAMQ